MASNDGMHLIDNYHQIRLGSLLATPLLLTGAEDLAPRKWRNKRHHLVIHLLLCVARGRNRLALGLLRRWACLPTKLYSNFRPLYPGRLCGLQLVRQLLYRDLSGANRVARWSWQTFWMW